MQICRWIKSQSLIEIVQVKSDQGTFQPPITFIPRKWRCFMNEDLRCHSYIRVTRWWCCSEFLSLTQHVQVCWWRVARWVKRNILLNFISAFAGSDRRLVFVEVHEHVQVKINALEVERKGHWSNLRLSGKATQSGSGLNCKRSN